MVIRFAAIGIEHNHIFGLAECLRAAGAEFAGYFSASETPLLAEFQARYGDIRRAGDVRELLEDETIHVIVSAAIGSDRAGIAAAAMRHGKDVLLDKPGMTSLAQLAELRSTQRQTGRICAIFYGEHFGSRSTVKAAELVAGGAIGRVVHMTGLGPHPYISRLTRPSWFYSREQSGGILVDIAAHQFEQFLHFAGTLDAEVLSATVANVSSPNHPGFFDLGDVHLQAPGMTGLLRVDWLMPPSVPVWGDVRLFLLGTEGYLEIRKVIDPAGVPGADHLIVANGSTLQRIDCAGVDLPFGRQFLADVRERTETAISQALSFKAMELALTAQRLAEQQYK